MVLNVGDQGGDTGVNKVVTINEVLLLNILSNGVLTYYHGNILFVTSSFEFEVMEESK
jgi:hypothetical protein